MIIKLFSQKQEKKKILNNPQLIEGIEINRMSFCIHSLSSPSEADSFV